MFKLYDVAELDEIKKNLLDGVYKFKYEGRNLEFKNTNGMLINYTDNKYKGLTFNTHTKLFIISYPHIDNYRGEFSSGLIQPKYNGTNLGFVKSGQKYYFRTRGSIDPEKIINELNTAVLTDKIPTGIDKIAFENFKKVHKDVISEGQRRRYIDDYGNVILENYYLNFEGVLEFMIEGSQCAYDGEEIIGVFGEMVYKYNPIAVDGNLKFGKDEEGYYIFDYLVKAEGSYYLVPSGTQGYELDYINYAKEKGVRLVENIDATFDTVSKFFASSSAEGVIIKSENVYWKLKREEVIAWQRLMGNLTSIVDSSVNHVFEEVGFSRNEIIENKYFLNGGEEDMINAVKSEILSHNITLEELDNYYKEKKFSVEAAIRKKVKYNIARTVVSFLADDVPKESVWLEIPNYMDVGGNSFKEWNEKRGKYVPTKSYANIVSSIIGLVYLKK